MAPRPACCTCTPAILETYLVDVCEEWELDRREIDDAESVAREKVGVRDIKADDETVEVAVVGEDLVDLGWWW